MPLYIKFQQEEAELKRRIDNRQIAFAVVGGAILLILAIAAFDAAWFAFAPLGDL